MKRFRAFPIVLFLALSPQLFAGPVEDQSLKLWKHEQAHQGNLAQLADNRVLMDRILATLEVCELDVAEAPPNFDKWYATRVSDLKSVGAARLQALSQDPRNEDRAEATTLLRRVQALRPTLLVKTGKSGLPGINKSSSSGAVIGTKGGSGAASKAAAAREK